MKSKAFASGKLLLVTALAAITLGIGAAAAKDLPPLPEAIASKGVLRVGTKCDYPPDGYLNEQGKPVGVEVDMARQIAEYAFGDKSKVQFTCVTTANRIPSLVGGKIDLMIATMGITKKRAEVVGVSQPYAWGASDLLVPNDSPIKKLDDIKGKKIIVIKGAWQIPWLEKHFPHLEMLKLNTVSDAVQALLQGRGVAYGHDLNVLYGIAAKNPKVRLVGDLYKIGYRGAAVRKGEKEWLAYVDAALVKMREEGKVAEFIKKHVKPELQPAHLKAFDPSKAPKKMDQS